MRLRYDKVALRFTRELQDELNDDIPSGKTLVVTVTAPIRLASKTRAEVVERLHRKLAMDDTINGNGVRATLLRGPGLKGVKVAVFVHNADTDPAEIIASARDLLTASAAKTPG